MTLKLDIALTGQTVSAHILFHLLNISFNIKFRVLRQTLPYFKTPSRVLKFKTTSVLIIPLLLPPPPLHPQIHHHLQPLQSPFFQGLFRHAPLI